MDNQHFTAIKLAIDAEINALSGKHAGIKMGFELAGEFLTQGLLTIKEVNMLLWKWEMRAYRDLYVYPDPEIGQHDYIVGTA